MVIEKTCLANCWELTPEAFEDSRGFFFESFNQDFLSKNLRINFSVKQINMSYSVKNVLRGIHFQKKPKNQAKIVSCIEGKILDVAVDIDPSSSWFARHHKVILSQENKKQLLIPETMAHGFLVLSETARIMYLTDENYSPEHDTGIRYNDSDLAIEWDIEEDKVILSEKDKQLTTLKEFLEKQS